MTGIEGVYIGRFSPLHAGHERVIGKMIEECGVEKSLLIIGSSNQAASMRHFFSYADRRTFIERLYPDIRLVGLPDYQSDIDWMLALEDIIRASSGDIKQVKFYGGCEEDIALLLDTGKTCQVVNRFDGTTLKISATEVRDALIMGRDLEGMINPKMMPELKMVFEHRWEEFKRR